MQAASRQQRWVIQLSAYQYEIQYRTSKNNQNADTLSRLPLQEEGSMWEPSLFSPEEVGRLHCVPINSLPVSVQQIRAATQRDVLLSRVLHFTVNGWSKDPDGSSDLMPFYRVKDELTVEEGVCFVVLE